MVLPTKNPHWSCARRAALLEKKGEEIWHYGKRINNLRELSEARDQKRAVTVPKWMGFRCTPAAFAMNLTGDVLLRMFESGMFVYERKTK